MSDTAAAPHVPGDTLGRYRIVRTMGSGGMGAVYEARHVDLDKRVALKVLHPDVARNPVARARFLREGQAAASIHHPNVVEVFDVGHEDGVIYLVMEYLEGEDLADRLDRTGRMAVDTLCDMMLPVCLAVAAAHEVGVIHRDLKPENIFLAKTRDGIEPKLLDFGISKVPHGRSVDLTLEATALGTPQYMSPEQATRASQVDSRSDIYTLGLILYECAVGRRAFDGPDVYPILHAIVEGVFTMPRDLVPELPDVFEAIVLRAMSREPENRQPDALSLGRSLLPLASPAGRARWAQRFVPIDPNAPISLRPRAESPRVSSTTTLDSSSLEIPIALSTRRKQGRARTVWIVGAVATALVIAAALVPSRNPRLPLANTAPAAPPSAAAPPAPPARDLLALPAPAAPQDPAPLAPPTTPPTPEVAPPAASAPVVAASPRPRAPRSHDTPPEPRVALPTPVVAAPVMPAPVMAAPPPTPVAAPPRPPAATPTETARGANNAPIVE